MHPRKVEGDLLVSAQLVVILCKKWWKEDAHTHAHTHIRTHNTHNTHKHPHLNRGHLAVVLDEVNVDVQHVPKAIDEV